MGNKLDRHRRAKDTRCKIKRLGISRLTVHRTPMHIYAQIIVSGGKVLASASTLDKQIKESCYYGGNVRAASEVGKLIALRGKNAGIDRVAFDRSGFKYHGRVKALADAARAQGLEF